LHLRNIAGNTKVYEISRAVVFDVSHFS